MLPGDQILLCLGLSATYLTLFSTAFAFLGGSNWHLRDVKTLSEFLAWKEWNSLLEYNLFPLKCFFFYQESWIWWGFMSSLQWQHPQRCNLVKYWHKASNELWNQFWSRLYYYCIIVLILLWHHIYIMMMN